MTIVAAIDASAAARPVVERAIERAAFTHDDLHIVHVFQPPASVYPIEGVYLVDDEEFERAEHQTVWHGVSDLLDASSVTLKRVELRGYPASAITEYAEDIDAGLIVVGTRERGGFATLVLGSTSHAVIQDAPCDVLVVKVEGE